MVLTRDSDLSGEIYSLLYDLGIRADSIAFFHTAYAVRLAAEQPEKLLLVTKWLYPEVARRYRTSWKAVEVNIRRTSAAVWAKRPGQLERLARQPLAEKPRPAQFIAILADCLRRGYAA